MDPDLRPAGSRREPPLGQVGTGVGTDPRRPEGARLGKPFREEKGAREGEKQNKGEKKIRAQMLNLFRLLEGKAERDEHEDFGSAVWVGCCVRKKKSGISD